MSREWMTDAACADHDDPETFFPDERYTSAAYAIAICRPCPVRAECLAYALENNLRSGVWGGKTEDERMQLRRPDDHGTLAGARAHQAAGEPVCHRCAAALSWAERREEAATA